ncbi:hypothetical protein EYF80_046612 [Liparis tanakae]|uniref:Secreted protein n=1 Tax=Liparis tanakae TaxID=230148 RepID=A0A4Z2FQC6_9TELE|nr:hypothetical protein EYF80_046612 [Liparis tanakae]
MLLFLFLFLLLFIILILLSCTLVSAGRTQTTSVHPGINKFRLNSWSSGPWSSSGFRSPGPLVVPIVGQQGLQVPIVGQQDLQVLWWSPYRRLTRSSSKLMSPSSSSLSSSSGSSLISALSSVLAGRAFSRLRMRCRGDCPPAGGDTCCCSRLSLCFLAKLTNTWAESGRVT